MVRDEPIGIDLKILSWLAECRRNGFLAVPLSPDVEKVLSESGREWTQGLGCFEFDVEYEPRSIATSPDGLRVAIGTKAGTVHQAVYRNGRWNFEDPLHLTGPGGQGDARQGRAIRSLAFIGNRWLVAGRGQGIFTVIDLAGNTSIKDYGKGYEAAGSEDPWLLRFTGIIPLFPGSEIPPGDQAALALGLTPGRYLHLLRQREDSFEVNRIPPEDLLGPRFPGDWLVDGQWWGKPGNEKLWLLDSAGRIHRYRLGGDKSLGIEPDGSQETSVLQVPYLRPRTDPRSLSPCQSGLALRFGEDVTFVPFEWLEGNETKEAPHWVTVPGAFRCLAVQEFDTEDRVYLAVATAEAGLRWIPWQKNATGRTGPLFPNAQPQVFEGVVGSILETALVHPEGIPYMVQGTRDHRMRIVSLLDKAVVDRHMHQGGDDLVTGSSLSELIDRFLRAPRSRGTRDFLNKAAPGVALMVVQGLIGRELGVDPFKQEKLRQPLQQRRINQLFEKLEIMDLYKALRFLKTAWRSVLNQPHREEVSRADIYRRFCLLIFQQAARLDEASLQYLARAAFDDIEEYLRRTLSNEEWQEIASFGGFLRKWFIYGYTYGEKRLRLLELAEWNSGCGRNLDALFYLTRVLRSRVDTRWERSVQPTGVSTGIWDMAAPPDAPFFVHSHTDGRVFATDSDGRALIWRADPEVAGILEEGQISICDNGLGLQHSMADQYRSLYRHGPYTRCLHIGDLGNCRFLLVFGVRGWHPADLRKESPRRNPRLVTLEILWVPKDGQEENREEVRGGSHLLICEAAIRITLSEIYSITRIPARADPEDAGYHLAVGTGGVWAEAGAPVGSRPSQLPFVEVEIRRGQAAANATPHQPADPLIKHTARLSCVIHQPGIVEDPRWRGFNRLGDPPALLEQGPNPTWSADALVVQDAAGARHVWLWIGMHDGRVRPFLWDQETRRWLEGGHRMPGVTDEQIARPWLEPILTYSTVRKLRCLQPPADESGPHTALLAYGTADGVLGVVTLDRLASAGPDRKAGLPWVHLVHSRQQTGIRGLADYLDGEQWNLAALTEEGYVILYHLGHHPDSHRQEGSELMHRGLLLDRFQLVKPTRALVAARWREARIWRALRQEGQESTGQDSQIPGDAAPEGSLPILVVGDSDGTVSGNALVAPKYSARRSQDAVPLTRDLIDLELNQPLDSLFPRPFTHAVGRKEEVHPWLRLCAVGQNNLLRFSIWYELWELRESHLKKSADGFPALARKPYRLVTRYGRKLHGLADEVYSRRPFRPDGAQILWSETGKYARKVAESCLDAQDEDRHVRLSAYNYLLLQIDHLCNRWIGADQAIEAWVLIDSFSELFNWASLVLIASAEPSPLEDSLQETRKLLIFKVVQRRLRHDDIRVAVEAIRTINEALLRAIQTNSRRAKPWTFVHRSSADGSPGYYDLLALVGELVRQQAGRLMPSDPLYSEISKFFALSILLVPEGTLIVGHVVSESWLAERGVDVGLVQTSLHLQRLAKEIGFTETEERNTQVLIQRFEDYLSREVDFEIDNLTLEGPLPDPASTAWRRLLAAKWDPEAPPLTDLHYLVEHRRVLFTVARLARLSQPSEEIPDDHSLDWLTDDEVPTYFSESKEYLQHLRQRRDELAELIRPESPPNADEIALEICKKEELRLGDWPHLVEPQKSHYREIIQRWRQVLDRRGSEARQLFEEARQLVELIDRFNRHVYRTSADDLMVSLLELALRSAPLAFSMPHEEKNELPLRLRVLERIGSFPFLADLFQRGTLLVQRSHLAGVLLHLARVHIGSGSADEAQLLSKRDFDLTRLWKTGKEIADLEGVDWQGSPKTPPPYALNLAIPGNDFIWATVLQELARNIYAYCGTTDQKAVFHMRWSEVKDPGGETYWCLTIGGNRAFYATMEKQNQIKINNDPKALLDKVRAIESNPGVRYGPERRGSYGFGLYFLMKLAGLLPDVKSGLFLSNPEVNIDFGPDGLIQPDTNDFSRLKTHPLTMAFWWKRDNGK